ncbi:hypothetical protein R1T16_13825 [Flavobacterium sp. DG1-102-2]|uniref:BglII/BstYI family type II restriction endonuclease n=1 Tax=Flavobacterium sp. DG1-102-2 TaxID=3081663 RepID=UPI002948D75C|nr:BglII/BstYI family type II restriction endonuclease [Flavobacterium sp. DG1-102-2]MDV6169510.1 hypothetical protein [Flavobacterium sp. DG1-102-2]
MKFRYHSFRHAEAIFNEPEFTEQLVEILQIVNSITEDELITRHESYGAKDIEKTPKSLSVALNSIFKERFTAAEWHQESKIFQDSNYKGETWRLDFAKKDVSIEVAFNHSTVIAWNLIKPVLASELNHVEKAIQTKLGVIITATEALKKHGGFDPAIGTYEKFLEHLPPLNNLLTVPLFIIGLDAPDTFHVKKHQHAPRKKIGKIIMKEMLLKDATEDDIEI